MDKGSQKAKAQANAGRLAHLWNAAFRLEGFSNEDFKNGRATLAAANTIKNRNFTAMKKITKTKSS